MAEEQWVGDVFTPQPQSERQAPEHLPGYRSAWMLADACGVSYTTIRRWTLDAPKPQGTASYQGMRWWSPEDARWFLDKAIALALEKKTKWR